MLRSTILTLQRSMIPAHRLSYHRKTSPPATTPFPRTGDSSSPIHKMLPEQPATLVLRRFLFLVAVSLSCVILFRASDFVRFLPLLQSSTSGSSIFPFNFSSAFHDSPPTGDGYRLEKVLKDAAMEDRTVIVTAINEAWAAPNSVIDLFLESFKIGYHTHGLLNHLVIIALDQKAFARCLVIHTHCFSLVSDGVDFRHEAYFMTPDYLKMMWKRINFLRSVLEMGYNFVFTESSRFRLPSIGEYTTSMLWFMGLDVLW